MVGIDWLNLTFPVECRRELSDYVQRIFGEFKSVPWKLHNRYESVIRSEQSGIIAWTDGKDGSPAIPEAFLNLPGALIGSLDEPGLNSFLCQMVAFEPFATRLDLRFDDFDKIVRPSVVYQSVKDGLCSTFRKSRFIESKIADGDPAGTCELGVAGKNGCGKMYCIYDKFIQSGGAIDSIRWELRYYKERANDAFWRLCQSAQAGNLTEVISALIGGECVFDQALLPWWAEIKQKLGNLRIATYRKTSDIEQKMTWFYKSMSKLIAQIDQHLEKKGLAGVEDFLSACKLRGYTLLDISPEEKELVYVQDELPF